MEARGLEWIWTFLFRSRGETGSKPQQLQLSGRQGEAGRVTCWGDRWQGCVSRSRGQMIKSRQAVSTDHWTLTLAKAAHLNKGSVRVTKQRPAGIGLRKFISGKCQAFPNNFPHSSMKSLSKYNNASNMSINTSSAYIVPALLLLGMPNWRLNRNILMCWLSILLRSSI